MKNANGSEDYILTYYLPTKDYLVTLTNVLKKMTKLSDNILDKLLENAYRYIILDQMISQNDNQVQNFYNEVSKFDNLYHLDFIAPDNIMFEFLSKMKCYGYKFTEWVIINHKPFDLPLNSDIIKDILIKNDITESKWKKYTDLPENDNTIQNLLKKEYIQTLQFITKNDSNDKSELIDQVTKLLNGSDYLTFKYNLFNLHVLSEQEIHNVLSFLKSRYNITIREQKAIENSKTTFQKQNLFINSLIRINNQVVLQLIKNFF